MSTTKLTSRFEKGLVYATQLHQNQVRKGSDVPYISHLLSVAALVLEDGGDEDQAIAALLHDAIEDQGGDKTRQEIKELFGEKVTNIVNGCTDSEILPKPPWHERKQQYIKKMRFASPEDCAVSLADKLHNLRSILADYHRGDKDIWQKFTGGKDGSLWYYRSLIKVCQQKGSSYLVEECDRLVKQLEKL